MKRNAVILTLFGIFAVAVMRFLQFGLLFDQESGFFADDGVVSWIALAMGAAAVAGTALMTWRDKNYYGCYKLTKNLPLGLTSLLVSAVMLCGAWGLFLQWSTQRSTGKEEVSAIGFSMWIPFLIATVLFAVFMAIAAVVALKGSPFFGRFGLVPLLSVLWTLFLLLFMFVHYTISVLTTENLFVILTSVLLALAYMNLSKFISGMNPDGRVLYSVVVSCCAGSVFSLGWSLSSLVKYLLGIHAKGDVPLPLTVMILAAGAYVLVFLMTLSFEPMSAPEKESAGGRRYKKKMAP